jgi:Flp pilus assembly protein TadD
LIKALAALRESVRLDPRNPGPHNTIAQILRAQGDLEGSRKAFEEAAQLKAAREAEQARTFRKAAAASRAGRQR